MTVWLTEMGKLFRPPLALDDVKTSNKHLEKHAELVLLQTEEMLPFTN